MKLSHSLEDYLETILFLEEKNRVARVKDIAHRLGVQMPSVTGALKTLKQKGLVDYEKNSFITLTGAGLQEAQRVEKKHTILKKLLYEILGLEEEEAEEEACQMEHALSDTTARRLRGLVDYLYKNPADNLPSSREAWINLLEKKSIP